jgi:hypothetical protein
VDHSEVGKNKGTKHQNIVQVFEAFVAKHILSQTLPKFRELGGGELGSPPLFYFDEEKCRKKQAAGDMEASKCGVLS